MASNFFDDGSNEPPFETSDLRNNLAAFLDTPFTVAISGLEMPIGNFKWGVYAFYDYDGEPIYVGQTNELVRTRIRRHLTNQRTDAVAMSVLDPFEVFEIEVFPIPEFQDADKGMQKRAKAHLDALEYEVYSRSLANSAFGAVLNEKAPPSPTLAVEIPTSVRGAIVSDEVARIRAHPDFRIARRSLTISRLAQVISERKVKPGLRQVLLVQAQRLQWLAQRRLTAMEGKS